MNSLTKKGTLDILKVLDRIGKGEDIFSSLTDDLFHFHGYSPLQGISNPNFSPALDIIDNDNQYIIKIEVPGVEKDKVEIEIDEDVLIIKGEKKDEYEENKKDVYVNERYYGSFRREIRIPGDCDQNSVDANYKDGVLCITIPKLKLKEKEKRKITIST